MESMDMEEWLHLEDHSERNVKDKEIMREISTEAMLKCIMDAYKGQWQTKQNICRHWGGRQVGDIMQIHCIYNYLHSIYIVLGIISNLEMI